jgi:hypothetical protein
VRTKAQAFLERPVQDDALGTFGAHDEPRFLCGFSIVAAGAKTVLRHVKLEISYTAFLPATTGLAREAEDFGTIDEDGIFVLLTGRDYKLG